MSSRSLNKVTLIGNLTRDPELRYTPAGTAVCTFGLATNRSWTTQTGEQKEDTEFHRIVAWNKLGELCAQLLTKGRKTYVEGRLSTHSWTAQDGTQRTSTEVVIEDMIILDSKRPIREGEAVTVVPQAKADGQAVVPVVDIKSDVTKEEDTVKASGKKAEEVKKKGEVLSAQAGKIEVPINEDITPDDIPF